MALPSLSQIMRNQGRSNRGGARGIVMTFTGGPELAAGLRELGDFAGKRTAKNALSRGLIKAAQPMVSSAQAHVRSSTAGTGELASSISASTRLSRRQKRMARKVDKNTVVQVFVGPDHKRGAHGVLLEFGTEERRTGGDFQGLGGKSTGRMMPEPFMRPAFDGTHAIVLHSFAPFVWAEIKKAAERVRKKVARAHKQKSAGAGMRAAALARMRRGG